MKLFLSLSLLVYHTTSYAAASASSSIPLTPESDQNEINTYMGGAQGRLSNLSVSSPQVV